MSAAIVQNNNINYECGGIKTVSVAETVTPYIKETTVLDEPDTTNTLTSKEHFEVYSNAGQRIHNVLTRTSSQPQTQKDANVNNMVSTLINNLGNMSIHRKLERTQSEPLPQQVNTSRYKTELCRPFEESGECKYGEKCQFAHGYNELRNLQRHPKYKTEYCRTFHSVGFCPYGPRCHFVHNYDEARAFQQLQQSKLKSHHSNFNQCISNFSLSKLGSASASVNKVVNHILPLSPPLSLSTGSDRESPTGSLSLSPTNSITNFLVGDQKSQANSVFPNVFSYGNTPPESPNAPVSPVNTPSPTLILGLVQTSHMSSQNPVQTKSLYVKPAIIPVKQVLQKSSSSPIAVIKNNVNITNKTPTKVNSVSSLNNVDGLIGVGVDDARLPVFNRLSSAVDDISNIDL